MTDHPATPDTKPIARLEAYLADFIDQRPFPANLADAIRYAVFGPGKRLRPLLCIQSCRAVGGDEEQAFPPAAAIEMIHCFSLIHDDLPAMDDDDLRRGRPTLHVKVGEAMAILAGDALNTLAFELFAQRTDACRLIEELAVATNDMIAGQVYDTIPDFDESVEPIERLRTIHRNKTGALIRCACRMGAIAGGADDDQLDAVTDYAEAIGLMFQVVDDLLDVTQTTEQLGKVAGKDAEQGKLTYPGLIGVDASRQQVEALLNQAHAALDRLQIPVTQTASTPETSETSDGLRQLADYMAVRLR
jgi:geranylgeranyl pyrophosphate synthase